MTIHEVSLDAGFDALKGIFNGLEGERVYIPNVAMKFQREENLGTDEILEDELYVKITSESLKENGTYAVGTMASRFSLADQSTSYDKKGDSDQTLIIMLTAIAYHAAKNMSDKQIEYNCLLSTGLPISEAKKENARANFKNKLKKGTHLVEFVDSGRKVKITFEDVYVNTEGHAAMVNLTMDSTYKPTRTDLLKKTVLIDDIGGTTTDLAVIRNGKIDTNFSTGLPTGINNTLDDIIQSVLAEFSYQFKTRRQLVACITNAQEPYTIRPQNRSESIKDIVDKHLKEYAAEHYKQLEYTWDKLDGVDSIQCVGGSAFLIKNFLMRLNEDKANFPIEFRDTAKESIWCIAEAYQKLLYLKSKKAGVNQ